VSDDYPIYFDGVTYNPPRDASRLRTQLWRVFVIMTDGREHTLFDLSDRTGGSEAGVSARLRDLRKPRFGAWTVTRRRIEGGLWGYTLWPRQPEEMNGTAARLKPQPPDEPVRQADLFAGDA
jgi:hypothetical protein